MFAYQNGYVRFVGRLSPPGLYVGQGYGKLVMLREVSVVRVLETAWNDERCALRN
jgi:hypothetical protein